MSISSSSAPLTSLTTALMTSASSASASTSSSSPIFSSTTPALSVPLNLPSSSPTLVLKLENTLLEGDNESTQKKIEAAIGQGKLLNEILIDTEKRLALKKAEIKKLRDASPKTPTRTEGQKKEKEKEKEKTKN